MIGILLTVLPDEYLKLLLGTTKIVIRRGSFGLSVGS
jgi:hypothetical protein